MISLNMLKVVNKYLSIYLSSMFFKCDIIILDFIVGVRMKGEEFGFSDGDINNIDNVIDAIKEVVYSTFILSYHCIK